MKQTAMTKAMLSALWLSIWEDSQRMDQMGRAAPLVPITGAVQSRQFNRLMAEIERRFAGGEPPINMAAKTWESDFPDELGEDGSDRQYPVVLGRDELELAKRFWETLTRNRPGSTRKKRDTWEAVDRALETAADYQPQ